MLQRGLRVDGVRKGQVYPFRYTFSRPGRSLFVHLEIQANVEGLKGLDSIFQLFNPQYEIGLP